MKRYLVKISTECDVSIFISLSDNTCSHVVNYPQIKSVENSPHHTVHEELSIHYSSKNMWSFFHGVISRVVSKFFWMEFSPRNNFHSVQKSLTYVLFETNPDKPVFSIIWDVNVILWIHAQWHIVESEALTCAVACRHCICANYMRAFVNKVYYKWDLNIKLHRTCSTTLCMDKFQYHVMWIILHANRHGEFSRGGTDFFSIEMENLSWGSIDTLFNNNIHEFFSTMWY